MADAGNIANNGVNVAALIAAREALTDTPAAAQFKWRAACEWKDGTHSHSTVEGFYGLGQEQRHRRTFTFDADHPFGAKFARFIVELLSAGVRVEDELREAFTVAEVDENEIAMIAVGMHPPGEFDGLPDIRMAELAAGVGSVTRLS